MNIGNTNVYGFEDAIRGMRNPLNSWGNSDSYYIKSVDGREYILGEKDKDLCHRLLSTPSDSDSKFLRMIYVNTDIVAPVYWINELVTYKISTTMNSTSLQHTGMKKDFTINDFELDDSRIYEILNPIDRDFKIENPLIYPYETDEYKIYELSNGRKYKVFRNGKIVACSFDYIDSYGSGRARHFDEHEINPYQTNNGYWAVRIGGRKDNGSTHILLHRLVANAWLGDRSNEGLEINHINKKRGDCSVENLEWVTHSENEIHKNETYSPNLASLYKQHRKISKFDLRTKSNILNDKLNGMTIKELCNKYHCSISTIESIQKNYSDFISLNNSTNALFERCDVWYDVIEQLNELRALYKETNDYSYFRMMRQLLPMSYRYRFTWSANYAVLRNIYRQRKNHRLSEWHEFCKWIESLPYAEDLITYGIKEKMC